MINRIAIPTLISLLTLAACGSGEFTISSSQGTSGLTATGKSDAVRACEIERALAIVNDPATTEDDLKSIGFYSRARRNVLAHRAGADVAVPAGHAHAAHGAVARHGEGRVLVLPRQLVPLL